MKRRSITGATPPPVKVGGAGRGGIPAMPYPPVSQSPTQEFNLESGESKTIIRKHKPISVPKSDFGMLPLYRSISSTIFDTEERFIFTIEPAVLTLDPELRLPLFNKKCNQCNQLCKFLPGKKTPLQIQFIKEKELVLMDILATVKDKEFCLTLTEQEYSTIFNMFNMNVMRAFPDPPALWHDPSGRYIDDVHIEEQAWPHLTYLYDIILAFLTSPRLNTSYCPMQVERFQKTIVYMFFSLDSREVEKAMKVFHAYYRFYKQCRESAQKAVARFFATFLESNQPYFGIRMMLSFYQSIASGFKVPLFRDHITFFKTVFIELQSSPFFWFMGSTFKPVLLTFLSKEPSLVRVTLEYMRSHWPITSPPKETLFLDEIESVSEYIDKNDLETIKILCGICTTCLNSQHYNVVEKALMMWNLEHFRRLISGAATMTYPIILPVIYNTASTHWLEQIRNLAVGAMQIMHSNNPDIFNEVGNKMNETNTQTTINEYNIGVSWIRLIAAFGPPSEQASLRDTVCDIYKGFK